ncbi:hypothetical protein BDV19DRAFT_382192 [Aspergillus venezuelensis]
MKSQRWLMYSNPRVRLQWLSTTRRLTQSRRYASDAQSSYKPLEVLQDANIDTFRDGFFKPGRPLVLPRQNYRDLPAYDRWFHHSATKPNASQLNTEYLAAHGADALVPLELTQSQRKSAELADKGEDTDLSFRKFHAPLSLFLQWIREAESQQQGQLPMRLYLAQCQLLDLPQTLRDDFPTPKIVAETGKGDVYDTNVWIGYPPTYTPLHRDPNPNLFVQLAGRKVVRLLPPQDGQVIFSHARRQLGRSGSREAAAFRGEEMMQGQERALLEQAVWSDSARKRLERNIDGYEAELEAGDGLFIPKGWWHSIKGLGDSVTASVSLRTSAATTASTTLSHSHSYSHLTKSPASTLFAQCHATNLYSSYSSLYKPQPRLGSYSTMSSSSAPENPTLESQQQQQQQQQEERKEPLLALPDSSTASDATQLDVNGDGVKLDHLGPLIVNTDGTLARIGNWAQMTEMERKNTLRIIGKRNKERLAKIKKEQGESEAGEEKKE